MKIKKGDNVQIFLGRDHGKSGEVLQVFPKKGKMLVANINTVKRHVKKMGDMDGGIIDLPKPIPVSNAMLLCPSCKKPTRVGFVVNKEGKLRFCKKCKKEIVK